MTEIKVPGPDDADEQELEDASPYPDPDELDRNQDSQELRLDGEVGPGDDA